MLTLSSHTSHPQPKPSRKPILTVNDATSPAMPTLNDA
jgi:hypothetical protein